MASDGNMVSKHTDFQPDRSLFSFLAHSYGLSEWYLYLPDDKCRVPVCDSVRGGWGWRKELEERRGQKKEADTKCESEEGRRYMNIGVRR